MTAAKSLPRLCWETGLWRVLAILFLYAFGASIGEDESRRAGVASRPAVRSFRARARLALFIRLHPMRSCGTATGVNVTRAALQQRGRALPSPKRARARPIRATPRLDGAGGARACASERERDSTPPLTHPSPLLTPQPTNIHRLRHPAPAAADHHGQLLRVAPRGAPHRLL